MHHPHILEAFTATLPVFRNGVAGGITLLIIVQGLAAQDLVRIVTPADRDTISGGMLFASIRLDTAVTSTAVRITLSIDDTVDLTDRLRATRSGFSCLARLPLSTGSHFMRVRVTTPSGGQSEAKQTFFVSGGAPPGFVPEPIAPAIRVNGEIGVNSRMSSLTASSAGRSLLQMPSPMHDVTFGFTVQHRSFEIPVRMYLTNLENTASQPRNRISVGFRSAYIDADGGDLTPQFDRLVLDGTPVRGGIGRVKLPTLDLAVVYGEVRRGIEGSVAVYDPSQGFPPGNLEDDSVHYILPGTYRRSITALNFRWHAVDMRRGLSFSLLKSGDDQGSIRYGASPSQNVAGSLTFGLHDPDLFLSGDAGLAMSVTTRDISMGMVSDSAFRSALGTSPPVDLGLLEKVLIVNSSTYPLNFRGFRSLAFTANIAARYLEQQRFTFNCDYIGPAYSSFGNPYMLSDRFTLSASNMLIMVDNKVMLQLVAGRERNNLADLSQETMLTERAGATLMLRPGITLPTLNMSFQGIFMSTRPHGVESYAPLTRIAIWMVTGGYSLKAWNIHHEINATVTNNLTTIYQAGIGDRSHTSIGINILETIAEKYRINAGYTLNASTIIGSPSSTQNTFTYGVGAPALLSDLQVRANGMISTSTDSYSPSTRMQHSVSLQYGRGFDMQGILEAGWSRYRQSNTAFYDYDEYFIDLRVQYRFSL